MLKVGIDSLGKSDNLKKYLTFVLVIMRIMLVSQKNASIVVSSDPLSF